ncbi:hypothetical protein RB195_016807 [Necator americanus]|uniref:Uncharacterized protein n=1 Tax=Necator americanus TaxID=51031 RepID=A0ABR1C295_NECAM
MPSIAARHPCTRTVPYRLSGQSELLFDETQGGGGDEQNYSRLYNLRPRIRILHLKSAPPQIRGMLPLTRPQSLHSAAPSASSVAACAAALGFGLIRPVFFLTQCLWTICLQPSGLHFLWF